MVSCEVGVGWLLLLMWRCEDANGLAYLYSEHWHGLCVREVCTAEVLVSTCDIGISRMNTPTHRSRVLELVDSDLEPSTNCSSTS